MARLFDPLTPEGELLLTSMAREELFAAYLGMEESARDNKADAYALKDAILADMNENRASLWEPEVKDEGYKVTVERKTIYDPVSLLALKEEMSDAQWDDMLTRPKMPARKVNLTKLNKLLRKGEPYVSIADRAARLSPPELKVKLND